MDSNRFQIHIKIEMFGNITKSVQFSAVNLVESISNNFLWRQWLMKKAIKTLLNFLYNVFRKNVRVREIKVESMSFLLP